MLTLITVNVDIFTFIHFRVHVDINGQFRVYTFLRFK